MDVLCGISVSNTTTTDLPDWLPLRSACHGHVLNIAVALTATYVSILLYILLRCAEKRRLRGCTPVPPPTASGRMSQALALRCVLSLMLLLSLIGELAEAVLALSSLCHPQILPAVLPVAAAASSLAAWLSGEMLSAALCAALDRRAGILHAIPPAVSLFCAAARCISLLHLVQSLELLQYTRPLLVAASATLYFSVALVDAASVCGWTLYYSVDQAADLHPPHTTYNYGTASLYSKATFYWLTPLLRIGNASPLELEDLGKIPNSESTLCSLEKLKYLYDEQKVHSKDGKSVSLWRCYITFCWKMFVLGGVFKLFGDMVGFIGPLGISVIVRYVVGFSERVVGKDSKCRENVYVTNTEFFSNGYIMGILICLAGLAQGTFSQCSTHLINVEGIRLKAALQALVYDKALKLPLWSFSDLHEDRSPSNGQNAHSPSVLNNSDNLSDAKSQSSDNHSERRCNNSSTDVGSITNHMSEDAINVMSFIWIGHYLWAIPVKIAVLMFLLCYKLGQSAMVGATFCILIMTPLQFVIGKKMSSVSKAVSDTSDERIRHINEILQGMKLLKLHCWEAHYKQRVELTREKELRLLNQDSFYWALMTFLTHASSTFVTLVTFGVHTFLEEAPLSASEVFAGLALFNQLTVPLFIFPIIVPIVISAKVSTKRLEVFFSLPEVQLCLRRDVASSALPLHSLCSSSEVRKKMSEEGKKNETQHSTISSASAENPAGWLGLGDISEGGELVDTQERVVRGGENTNGSENENSQENNPELEKLNTGNISHHDEFVIDVRNGIFSWSSERLSTTLTISNISIPKGKMTLIVGPVGSGKTSLLLALLGEMPSIQPSSPAQWSRNASVAYCSQKPWLLNTSVRENILFGQDFHPRQYACTVSACALQPDLDILPAHDLTEIGEKGISLSGGQKHRVTIARALYSQADTVLLDDPLSALDYRVGQHLVEHGFRNLLLKQNRTLVLVTHCLQLLTSADHVLVMEHGMISAQGSPSEIEAQCPDLFQNLCRKMKISQDGQVGQRLTDGTCEKTARERWHLVRLVSRFGLQNHSPPCIGANGKTILNKPHQKFNTPQSLIHDLSFPSGESMNEHLGECQKLHKLLRRTQSTLACDVRANSCRHRQVKRVSSLQPRGVTRSSIHRLPASAWDPLGSPLDASCKSSFRENRIPSDTATMAGLFHPSLFHSVHRSVASTPETPVSPVRRLWSTSSTKSSAHLEEEAEGSPLDMPDSAFSQSSNSTERDIPDDQLAGRLMSEEERKYGEIPLLVYCTYLRACGLACGGTYILSTLTWQILRVCADFWLSDWTSYNTTAVDITQRSGALQKEMIWYLYGYAFLSLGTITASFVSNVVGQIAGSKARQSLHAQMLTSILQCPMKFFDTTPIGRIIHRFSNDVTVIDKKLTTSIQRLLQFLLLCFSSLMVNAALSPWILIVALPLCLAYYIVQHYYRVSSRELQRLDSLTCSPVLSHFSETLGGLATIRAFEQQTRFMKIMLEKMDTHNNTLLILSASNRWLGIGLDYLGAVIVLMSVFGAILAAQMNPGTVTPSLVGLTVNYTLLVPIYLNWVVKFVADVEMNMGAVERVKQYTELPKENLYHEDMNVSPNWPEKGDIVFQDVTLQYDEQRESVVSGLSLHIPAGQKVGLCGRTGSGKSSLAMSLFRMLNVSKGCILMDGIDICKLPTHLLRSRLSVIPQDIFMFSGSVRENLDPEGKYSEEALWHSLNLAQLQNMVENMPGKLDSTVKEGGDNLSVGTRQLFSLARAILQNSAVLVMDEATSSVDLPTEQALLSAAISAFSHRTVIIIAHRLVTLLECDRVLVLDSGRVVEDGSPAQLLKISNGTFSSMFQAASQASH